MSKINITPAELQGLISKMRQWSGQISSLRGSLQQQSSYLRSHWQDPNYEAFVQQVTNMARQMEANAKELDENAKTLQILKENLERTQQEYNRRMH